MTIEGGTEGKKRRAPARAWGKANQACEWLIRLLNNTPLFRLIALVGTLVGFVVIVGTAWQIWNDYIDRHEDRIDRAWNRLLRPLPGNSGKADAFEYLVKVGLSLSGTNLSCRAIGNYDPISGKCGSAPVFQDLDIGFGDGQISEFDAIDFSGVVFRNLQITNVWLKEFNLEDAKIDGLIAQGAFLDANGSPATMTNCSFPGSAVQDRLSGTRGKRSVISPTRCSSASSIPRSGRRRTAMPGPTRRPMWSCRRCRSCLARRKCGPGSRRSAN